MSELVWTIALLLTTTMLVVSFGGVAVGAQVYNHHLLLPTPKQNDTTAPPDEEKKHCHFVVTIIVGLHFSRRVLHVPIRQVYLETLSCTLQAFNHSPEGLIRIFVVSVVATPPHRLQLAKRPSNVSRLDMNYMKNQ